MIFYLQGRYVDEEEAKISVLDRGFLFGDSVYETLRSHRGRILFPREHLERLLHSAEMIEIDLDRDRVDPLGILRELIRRNDLANARFRMIVTRGVGLAHEQDSFTPSWIVTAEAFQELADQVYEAGVSAVLVSVKRHATQSLNPEIKSSNLLNNILARREAVRLGAFEGILPNPAGLIAEAAHSNVFWVAEDGCLRTPAREVGILPGITRQKVIEIARGRGMRVEEVFARPDELATAREIMLTSTSWEVLAVSSWQGRRVGDGRRGAVAEALRDALRDLYTNPEETA